MGGQGPEDVRSEHRRDHRSETAARLAADRPVLGSGRGSVVLVDVRDHLVAEVGVVGAGPRGVDELAAAVGRPGVDVDDDGRRCLSVGEDGVSSLEEGLAEGGPVAPHGDLSGVALDDVDAGVATGGLRVVAGWYVDPQRTDVGVPQRVPAQQGALDDVLVHTSGQFRGPGQHGPTVCLWAVGSGAQVGDDKSQPRGWRPRGWLCWCCCCWYCWCWWPPGCALGYRAVRVRREPARAPHLRGGSPGPSSRGGSRGARGPAGGLLR